MPYSTEFLDEIRRRAPLAETIGRHVDLVKRAGEYVGLCPFHSEKTASFKVTEAEDRGVVSRRVHAACVRGCLKDLEDRKGRPAGNPRAQELAASEGR